MRLCSGTILVVKAMCASHALTARTAICWRNTMNTLCMNTQRRTTAKMTTRKNRSLNPSAKTTRRKTSRNAPVTNVRAATPQTSFVARSACMPDRRTRVASTTSSLSCPPQSQPTSYCTSPHRLRQTVATPMQYTHSSMTRWLLRLMRSRLTSIYATLQASTRNIYPTATSNLI